MQNCNLLFTIFRSNKKALSALFCIKFSVAHFTAQRPSYTERSTLPDRRHLVQTYFLVGVPSSTTLTRWTFGAQILFDFLCE